MAVTAWGGTLDKRGGRFELNCVVSVHSSHGSFVNNTRSVSVTFWSYAKLAKTLNLAAH